MTTTRRSFLHLTVASAAALSCGSAFAGKRGKVAAAPAASALALVKPRALKPGDTVGLVAPASYTFDLWRLDDAAARWS